MKKLTLILITIIGLGLLYSCEKQLKDPVLDMSQAEAPIIVAPEDCSVYILLEENACRYFVSAPVKTTVNFHAHQKLGEQLMLAKGVTDV